MKLDSKNYDRFFKGFSIVDCVVRRKDFCYFILEQEYDEETKTPPKSKLQTRVITYVTQPAKVATGRIWGGKIFTGILMMKAGVSLVPKEQFVGVSLNDRVYVLGSGDDELENDLLGSDSRQLKAANAPREAYKLRGGIRRLKTIDGVLYGCGGGRTVITRQGRNDWYYHIDAIPYEDTAFNDIDGFSTSDIYAVGGEGDVWHYDGTQWQPIPFPSNVNLNAVCCGGDGQVYIASAHLGLFFVGRGNRWKTIQYRQLALPIRDMVWHQGKVWFTNDYGLWTIDNGVISEADVPGKIAAYSGHLSVGDGVMLLAGIYGAAMHDGEQWHAVIDFDDLD